MQQLIVAQGGQEKAEMGECRSGMWPLKGVEENLEINLPLSQQDFRLQPNPSPELRRDQRGGLSVKQCNDIL